ncbi:hypothetical protein [Streptomyces liangshanensis]|uniref:hypothetical protein n=1 Tax=Streptomyces liangshanensis TaxID=2717324 RepID=UPI0036D76804
MTLIKPGLYVRDGFAEGPLAKAALSRAARAAQMLDDIQEQALTLTGGQLRDGVHRALRRFTQEEQPARRVDSLTALIRCGVRIDWPVPNRLLRLTPARREDLPGPPAGREGPDCRAPPAFRGRWRLGRWPDERR